MIVLGILLVILALAPNVYGGDPVPPELTGSWTLSKVAATKLPSQCRNARLVFTSDRKLISLNGELRFVTNIAIVKRNGGFTIRQEIVEHNGKPNCQGKSAEHIVAHFVKDVYFERVGPVLRQYIWTKESGRFVDWVRVGST